MPRPPRDPPSGVAASGGVAAPRTLQDIRPLLQELKATLRDLYGERLAKLVLYGSFARGDATDASDIDVLVVLHGDVDEWTEIKRMSHVTYPIALKYEELVAKLPVSLDAYETRESPLFINVRKEGVEL